MAAPAPLHFNCRRPARSPRPGEEPRAAGSGSGAGTQRQAGCWLLAAGSGGPGARSPRRECSLHLAHCTHVCAGLARAAAARALAAKGLEPLGPAHPRESRRRGLFQVPHPGRGRRGRGGAVGGGARRGGQGAL